jgi:hypothetical protein
VIGPRDIGKRRRAIADRLAKLPQGEWARNGLQVLYREAGEWTELARFLTPWAAEFFVQAREDMWWLLQQTGQTVETLETYVRIRQRRPVPPPVAPPPPSRPRCECGDVLELYCCRCGQALCGLHVVWLPFADNPPAPRCYRGVGCSRGEE